jgi:hypothetical protein
LFYTDNHSLFGGFEERFRMAMEDGRIGHAELA